MVSEADLKAIETLLKNLREQGRGEERRDSVIRKARVDLPNLGVLPGQTPFTVGGRRGARMRNPASRFSPATQPAPRQPARGGPRASPVSASQPAARGTRGGTRGRGGGRGRGAAKSAPPESEPEPDLEPGPLTDSEESDVSDDEDFMPRSSPQTRSSTLSSPTLQATLLGALSPAGGAREAGLARALLRPSLLSLSLGPPPCHLSSRGQGPRLRKEPHRHSRGLRVQSFPPGKRLGPLGWPPCATSPRQPGESGRGQPPSPSRQPVSPRRRRNPGSSSTS